MSTTNPAKPTVQRHDARRRVVVASVPSGHVYVRHLAPVSPTATEIVRLPDPTSPWWPPSALDPEWIRAHADAFDLMHVHFGFDSLTPAQLMAVTEALRGAGKPLVLTVHDLRNPHHVTRQLHDDQLDVLVRAADAVLTLTDGAAREIRRRWGRWAWVVPHPHVVELDLLRDREQHHHAQARAVGNDFLIGVHLKSLRACMAGPPVVDALLDIARSEPGVRLRLDAHCDVALADGARFDPGLRASLDRAERAGADVRVHDYFSDADLWEYLASLDLSVLPYQFGTHSGWLEACRDLGTAVAAPRCGYYADQGASVSFELSEKGLDVESLARAIRQARLAGPPPPLSVDFRAAQRDEIARVHASTYLESPVMSGPPLRIALVAGTRFPVAEPFAGGMEAQTWLLAQGLTHRGHDVTVFAAQGSDPSIAHLEVLDGGTFQPSERARADVSMPPDRFLREHHAYQSLMLRLARDTSFDVVHLNTLHHLPVAMAELLPHRPLLTLHTPPTPWLESALTTGSTVRAVAVSRHTADAWYPTTGPIPVLHNGIDLGRWTPGPGGTTAVWTGRLVPEKGPHLAIEACRRAGVPLLLAGPAPDEVYLRERLLPLLGSNAEWVGHLGHDALSRLVGAAAVCVVTPCWDEPFGLVVAEALAVGTPVAAFRRGALPELLTPDCGVLVEGADVDALAAAVVQASTLDRRAVRRHAERTVDARRMVAGYEGLYRGASPAPDDRAARLVDAPSVP